jgi:hypothetical protein
MKKLILLSLQQVLIALVVIHYKVTARVRPWLFLPHYKNRQHHQPAAAGITCFTSQMRQLLAKPVTHTNNSLAAAAGGGGGGAS